MTSIAYVVMNGSREKAQYWVDYINKHKYPVVISYCLANDPDVESLRWDLEHWIQEKDYPFIYILRPLVPITQYIVPGQITLDVDRPADEERLKWLLEEYIHKSPIERLKKEN
jgi:hypothetical protein